MHVSITPSPGQQQRTTRLSRLVCPQPPDSQFPTNTKFADYQSSTYASATQTTSAAASHPHSSILAAGERTRWGCGHSRKPA
jgi:hypothetical protein